MTTNSDLDRIKTEYDQQGYSIVENVFTRDECLKLQALAEKLPSAVSGDLLPVMNPHRAQPDFIVPMSDERLLSIVRHLMKGSPVGLQTQYFYCRPGTRGFTSHQDNYYVRAPDDMFVSAWLALEDVSADNGALIVYPGSHREPVLEIRPVEQVSTFGQDPNHNRQECILPKPYSPATVAVRQGGVVFLHSHIVHSSNDNSTSDRFRRVLLMTYLAAGAPFRSGFIAKRETFPLHTS